MDSLRDVNKKIARIKDTDNARAYYRSNPDKKKESNDKWNKENRNEYQRAYRAKNK